jgi:hypothetical protein
MARRRTTLLAASLAVAGESAQAALTMQQASAPVPIGAGVSLCSLYLIFFARGNVIKKRAPVTHETPAPISPHCPQPLGGRGQLL